MTRTEIERVFRQTFNGHPNVLTPYITAYTEAGDYLVEVSRDHQRKLYGVTVLNRDGTRPEQGLSQAFPSRRAAEKYIAELANGGTQ